MISVLINGECKESISIFDRGLQYGDGLFETMAVYENKIQLWDAHWERLKNGCQRLSIEIPDKQLIENEIAIITNKKLTINPFVIKLIITRGSGERGYKFPSVQNTTRIISRQPWPHLSEEFKTSGIAVRYCETILSENTQLAGIKHLNRLEQVLARNEWNTNDFQEGLMLNANGDVVDGTMSNIFAVKDNIIFTPDLSSAGVSGVMRNTVIERAKELGFSVYEKTFSKFELENADELFITNSLIRIWPVRTIAKKRFTQIGKITKQLQQAVDKTR